MTPRRPLQVELDARLTAVTELLATGQSDGQVKQAVAERFGLSPRTVERYLRRAREGMVRSTGKDVDALRAEALAVYQAIIDAPATEARDRIKARERIDKLLGLEIRPPFAGRLEVSGPDGGPIQAQAAVVGVDLPSRLADFAKILEQVGVVNAMEAGVPLPALPAPDAAHTR